MCVIHADASLKLGVMWEGSCSGCSVLLGEAAPNSAQLLQALMFTVLVTVERLCALSTCVQVKSSAQVDRRQQKVFNAEP